MSKNMKVLDFFQGEKQEGEVGIEVEVEGTDLPLSVRGWMMTNEGSLRNGVEYVCSSPAKRGFVKRKLNTLATAFVNAGTVLDWETNRTSIHVHINVQDLSFVQVVNFLCLYYILEEVLVEFCGEERSGNLFCLRAQDADWVLLQLPHIIEGGGWNETYDTKFRYASVNLCALAKFGSLEFRSMRGTDDWDVVDSWVKMLLKLKDAALGYDTPDLIISGLSQSGEQVFLQSIMGEHAPLLVCDNLDGKLMDGVRRIQSIAYTPAYRWAAPPVPKKLDDNEGYVPPFPDYGDEDEDYE